jgi:hypothetical protein
MPRFDALQVRIVLTLRTLQALWHSCRGTAMVESALILPVFLTLVGGVYEFSFFLYQQQLATSGVRDAARYLALTADPNSLSRQTDARNLAVTGSVDGGPPRVPGWATSDISIVVNSVYSDVGTPGTASNIQIVTVSTNFTDLSLGFLGLLGLKSPTIAVSHRERFIGGSARG